MANTLNFESNKYKFPNSSKPEIFNLYQNS